MYNTVTCIPSEFNSPVEFNQLNRRDRHDKRRATNHVCTHYCDVMSDTFNIMPLLFNRVLVVVVVVHRAHTRDRLVRMYNEPRRDTGWQTWSTWLIFSRVPFLSPLHSSWVSEFYLARAERSRESCQPTIQHVYITTRHIYYVNVAHSLLNIHPVARKS